LVSSRLALATVAGAVLGLVVLAAPAAAIFNGHADGSDHPNVGALLAPQAFSDGTWANCSGTLISSTVFLTAAHCDLGQSRYAITFDSAYHSATGTTYWGTWHANPDYRPGQNDPHDLAVVVFDEPVPGITPAQLPSAGSLDNLESGQAFTSVGYGAQAKIKSSFLYTDTRFEAVGALRTMENVWLRISQNPALGNGGTCFADSGGPNFLGAGADETPIVAASTITGDDACRSTNVDYRLDLPSARDFLRQYVELP